MTPKEKILEYVKKQYHTEAEYLFKKFPTYCVLKHQNNKKWYGLIMTVEKSKLGKDDNTETDIIDLKINPELIGGLIQKEGYYKAYHMNKEHWISIDLNALDDVSDIYPFIDSSYEMTK